MTFMGRVQNGVVVLDDGKELAEGTVVRVEPAASPAGRERNGRARLLALVGSITDLPADLARNHDHYLYGHPRE